MTPNEWIGHNAFRITVSERWKPEGTIAFGQFMQHRDGTEMFYIRGNASISGPSERLRDEEVREAFGTLNVCHACVKMFCMGKVIRRTDKVTWLDPRTLEFQHHFSTTDRSSKRSQWGDLCEPCRHFYASQAAEKFRNECESLRMTPHVSWTDESA